jgi:hypothetical protein
LYDVYRNHLWLSSHPEDSIDARWGLNKCEKIQTQTRATRESMAFIERTYRKNDLKFADFALRGQRLVLQRLNAEWAQSDCTEALAAPKKKECPSPPPNAYTAGPRWITCDAMRREIRATEDSIAFIEKTYRVSEPDYADSSIRTQQELSRRLDEEWTRSGCE